jgi:hypothetical protein
MILDITIRTFGRTGGRGLGVERGGRDGPKIWGMVVTLVVRAGIPVAGQSYKTPLGLGAEMAQAFSLLPPSCFAA